MTNSDKNLPKGFRYLLTKKRARSILDGMAFDEISITKSGISYSEQVSKWVLELPSSFVGYKFGAAILHQSTLGNTLALDLYGLRVDSIGKDEDKILAHVLKMFETWLAQITDLAETAPSRSESFSLEFHREKDSGELIFREV